MFMCGLITFIKLGWDCVRDMVWTKYKIGKGSPLEFTKNSKGIFHITPQTMMPAWQSRKEQMQ